MHLIHILIGSNNTLETVNFRINLFLKSQIFNFAAFFNFTPDEIYPGE